MEILNDETWSVVCEFLYKQCIVNPRFHSQMKELVLKRADTDPGFEDQLTLEHTLPNDHAQLVRLVSAFRQECEKYLTILKAIKMDVCQDRCGVMDLGSWWMEMIWMALACNTQLFERFCTRVFKQRIKIDSEIMSGSGLTARETCDVIKCIQQTHGIKLWPGWWGPDAQCAFVSFDLILHPFDDEKIPNLAMLPWNPAGSEPVIPKLL